MLVAALVLGACGGGAPSRTEVLTSLAADTIVPAMNAAAASGDVLADATTALCAAPEADTLAAARAALSATRAAWKTTEAMWVGPVMERRSWALVDWPVRVDEIDVLVADTSTPIDDDLVTRRIGADQRGLGAVEHLLGDGDAALDELTDPRRCAFLVAVSSAAATELGALAVDWAVAWDGGPPYVEVLAATSDESLDAIVNDALFLLEAMTDAELGRAIGAMGEAPDPEAIGEGPAGLGVVDLAARLAGLRAVLLGNGDSSAAAGLGPLLGDSLSARLVAQFDDAEAAVGAIEAPLGDAVVHSPDQVAVARDAIKAIQVTIATEVVSRLGVTVGFSDADGDSAG